MWAHYRRLFIANQIFVAIVCAAMLFIVRMNIPSVVAIFIAMEVGAVLGAAWYARLRRKIDAHRTSLPLKTREQ